LTEPVAPAPPTAVATALDSRGIAGGASGLHFAIIPTTPYTVRGRDMCAREAANTAMFGGRFEDAANLFRGTVGEDGYFDGLLGTMADGLLSSPHPFQGEREMVSALSDADGTPGDDPIMHPFEEVRQCVKEACGFGYAIGQYTLSCWRCRASGNTNWEIAKAINSVGGEYVHEVCRRCDASRYDRPVGVREVFSLRRWPLQALWQETYSKQWHVTHRNGTIPIMPGDGEWALFRTVPEIDGWQNGPHLWAILAAIFARDARFDRQSTSMLATPMHIFQATGPTHPETRAAVEEQVRTMAFQNRIILPGEWNHEIHEPANRYHDVATGIIDDMRGMAEIGWFGNRISSSQGAAFTDAKPWFRVAAERRRALGSILAKQLREFGWQWWALDNFGTRNAPVCVFDTDSPEDKNARARAYTELGTGLSTLVDGLAKTGHELDPAWVRETMQRANVRIRKKEGGDTSKLPLGVDAVGSLVKGEEGRAGLGLGPFGDERDEKTINDLAEQAMAAAPELPQRRPQRRARR
jgi:hypothetical protein